MWEALASRLCEAYDLWMGMRPGHAIVCFSVHTDAILVATPDRLLIVLEETVLPAVDFAVALQGLWRRSSVLAVGLNDQPAGAQ
jgi:hypothetical protein